MGSWTYVVPVAASQLQHRGLEAELAHPGTGLVFGGQGQLARVVVPGADQVDGLDVGRGPQRKLELNGGHYERRLITIKRYMTSCRRVSMKE